MSEPSKTDEVFQRGPSGGKPLPSLFYVCYSGKGCLFLVNFLSVYTKCLVNLMKNYVF